METELYQNRFLHPIDRALEKLTGPVCWIDRTGYIVHFNDALTKLTGYSEKRLKSASLPLLEPSLDQASLEIQWALLRKGQVVNRETELVNAAGKRFPVSLSSIQVEVEGIPLACIQIKVQDAPCVTRDEFLEACLTGNRTAAWEWNLLTDTLYISDFFYDLFELDKAQRVSMANFLSLMKPRLSSTQLESLKKNMSEMRSEPFEFEQELAFYQSNGKEQGIKINGQLIRKNNLPILLRGQVKEISTAPDEINKAEALARKLMSISPQMVFWVNSDLSVRYANPVALQEMGFTENDLTQGLHWSDICATPSEAEWTVLFKEKKAEKNRWLTLNLKKKNNAAPGLATECHFELIEMEPTNMFHISANTAIMKGQDEGAKFRATMLEGLRLSENLEKNKANVQKEIQAVQENFITLNNNYIEFLRKLKMASNASLSVLLTGKDNGSKKLLANSIHLLSGRRDYPLIKIDCSLPPTLLEKELFGYEKNLYGITTEERKGSIETAEGGTVVLEDINVLPLAIQEKLHVVLREGKFERVGSSTTRKANARIVGMTINDLSSLVAAGKFSKDLYLDFQQGFVYDFPLQQEPQGKETAMQMRDIRHEQSKDNIHKSVINTEQPNETLISLEEKQRQHILHALKLTGGKVSGKNGAAELLNIHPQTLFSKMRKMGIKAVEVEKVASTGVLDI